MEIYQIDNIFPPRLTASEGETHRKAEAFTPEIVRQHHFFDKYNASILRIIDKGIYQYKLKRSLEVNASLGLSRTILPFSKPIMRSQNASAN